MNLRYISVGLTALLLASSGFAADHAFSGTRHKRREDQRKHFASKTKEAGFKKRSLSAGLDQRFAKRQYLTGDWWGHRQKTLEHGVTISGTYVTDIQGNVAGGRTTGYGQAGSFGIDFNFDMERLAHIPGLEFHVGGIVRSGVKLSAKKIGNEFPVGQVFGSETYLLGTLFARQSAFNNHLSIKIGRLNAGDDFMQSDLFYRYVSNAFCGNPIAIFFNTGFSAYPNSTWGAYIDYQLGDLFKAKLAVYAANADRKQNKYHGADFSFKEPGGSIVVTEGTYLINQTPKTSGMPGNVKVGTYYATSAVSKYTGGVGQNYGTYFQADQMVVRRGGKGSDIGLSAFGYVLFAPKDRNKFSSFFMTGLTYKGIIPCRKEDILSIGLARGNYSSVLRGIPASQAHFSVPGIYGDTPQHFEAVFEANYKVEVWKWFYITPDYQYIVHPGGTAALKNAHVIGAQVGVTF